MPFSDLHRYQEHMCCIIYMQEKHTYKMNTSKNFFYFIQLGMSIILPKVNLIEIWFTWKHAQDMGQIIFSLTK